MADYTGELPSTLGGVIWAPGHIGTFGWVFQEKGKGNRQNYGIVSELTHLGSYYGGWGFNLTDPADPTDPIYYFADGSVFGGGKRTPVAAVAGSTAPNWQAQFRRAPLFDPGYGPTSGTSRYIDPSVLRGPTWIPQLYDTTADTTTGNGIAAVAANRAQLLAEAIPSLTWCMGSHASTGLQSGRNFNLPTLVDQVNWPRGKPDNVTPEWRHSDMREVAYLYQYGVFDKIIAISKP